MWIVPGGDSLGGGAALFALNFVIGGLIGSFVLVWRLLVAAWYVPLTIYRLIGRGSAIRSAKKRTGSETSCPFQPVEKGHRKVAFFLIGDSRIEGKNAV